MWSQLIQICDSHSKKAKNSSMALDCLQVLMCELQTEANNFILTQNKESQDLPYGRYLIHRAEDYNIQLDVFSRDYKGRIHCHNTWGIVNVLQGSLLIENWSENNDDFCMQTSCYCPAGSSQCFSPPHSDWHRVSTQSEGAQTLSFHTYGKGFDLDEGIYLNDSLEKVVAKRSSFGHTRILEKNLVRINQ